MISILPNSRPNCPTAFICLPLTHTNQLTKKCLYSHTIRTHSPVLNRLQQMWWPFFSCYSAWSESWRATSDRLHPPCSAIMGWVTRWTIIFVTPCIMWLFYLYFLVNIWICNYSCSSHDGIKKKKLRAGFAFLRQYISSIFFRFCFLFQKFCSQNVRFATILCSVSSLKTVSIM